jgi:hypothetical protein
MLLATWGFAPLVALIIDVAVHGGVLSGSDGGAPSADQFQYMAWIREAGMHGLIANSFELTPTHAVFLQPMFLLSGIAWRLGLGIQLAYLVWKPVAMLALLRQIRFPRQAKQRARGRAAAGAVLPLAGSAGARWGGPVARGDAVRLAARGRGAVARMAAVGISVDCDCDCDWADAAGAAGGRARAHRDEARADAPSDPGDCRGGAGGLVHPWQGATLALIWVGLFIWGRGAPAYRRLAVPFAGTIAPLVYYEVLVHADSA